MLKPSGGVLKKAFGGAAGGAINAGGAGGAAGRVLASKKKLPTAAVASGAAKPASVLAGKLNRPKPPSAGKKAGGFMGKVVGKVGKAFGGV